MKKFFALILAGLMIFALASCGNTENNETTKAPEKTESTTGATETTADTEKPEDTTAPGNTTSGTPEEPEEPASLEELIEKIYENNPVELMLGTSQVDLSNADALKGATGISTSADKVAEAYLSEAMIGSQAYSMAVVRVKDAADAETVANEMLNGINQSKWICVTADELRVAACGDVIMLIMFDSAFEMDIDAFVDAFGEACGAEPDLVLKK